MDIQAAIATLTTTKTENHPFAEVERLLGAGETTASDISPEIIFKQLETAVRAGNQDIFRELIAAETQSRQENQPTILMSAVIAGKTEIVRSLVAAGADVNVRVKQFFTFDAMEFAVSNEYPEIVKILIEAGADLDWQAPFFPSVYIASASPIRTLSSRHTPLHPASN